MEMFVCEHSSAGRGHNGEKRMNGSFCFSGATKRGKKLAKNELLAECRRRRDEGMAKEEQQGEEVKKCKKRARDVPD